MGLDNFIQTAMRRVLKNPILTVLKDINFSSILKQSNFIKRDIGVSPYLITLQFLYMFREPLIINYQEHFSNLSRNFS